MLKKIITKILYSRFEKGVLEGANTITQEQLIHLDSTVKYDAGEELRIEGANHKRIGTDKIPSWVKDFSEPRNYRGSFYTLLTDAFLIGQHGTVVFDGKIVLDSILGSVGYLLNKSEKRNIAYHQLYKTSEHYEIGISLANCLANGYFHWLAETLPMLEAMHHYRHNNTDDLREFKVFINHNSPKFVKEYLLLMGVDDHQIVELSTNKVMVETLIVPTTRFYSLKNPHDYWCRYIYPKSAFDFVRNTALEKLETNSGNHLPKKIYLSRQDANLRGINQEQDLIDFLKLKGYESVVLSEFSVKAQIELFSGITHLITPHGAGIANTIFSTEIQIIELYPTKRAFGYNYHFYQTSNFYNHTHFMLLCECDDLQNMNVDLNLIDQILDGNK
jgi:hypothetical protein